MADLFVPPLARRLSASTQALIAGAGGGFDVYAACRSRSRSVTPASGHWRASRSANSTGSSKMRTGVTRSVASRYASTAANWWPSSPPGSGKSTMLNLIGTLDRPTTGLVRVDGYDVATLTDRQVCAPGGPGAASSSNGSTSPVEHRRWTTSPRACSMPACPHRNGGTSRSRRSRVGWGTGWNTGRIENSGGERQRVAIARAVVGSRWTATTWSNVHRAAHSRPRGCGAASRG